MLLQYICSTKNVKSLYFRKVQLMKMCKNVGHLYSATIPKDKLYSVK
jgi:hypothetical protein